MRKFKLLTSSSKKRRDNLQSFTGIEQTSELKFLLNDSNRFCDPQITSIDSFRWKIIHLADIDKEIDRESDLYSKVHLYLRLATREKLSEEDNFFFYRICREAEQDIKLEKWIEKIELILIKLEQNNPNFFRDNFLTLDEFILKARNIDPEKMTLDAFKNLVEKVSINEDLLNSYIPNIGENLCQYERIHSSRLINISLMLWKPGGFIPAHKDKNSISVIRVCQGTLSHLKNLPPDNIENPGKREKIDYFKDELVNIDYGQQYELSNQQKNQNLLTLHFRFYRPSDERDWEGLK